MDIEARRYSLEMQRHLGPSKRSRGLRLPRLPRRSWAILILGCLAVVWMSESLWGTRVSFNECLNCASPNTPTGEGKLVRGNATARFRDNLREDTKYITSWTAAGWTNDVMTLGNLMYLGMITNRVVILPPFLPAHHVDASASPQLFSKVFDLPRFRASTSLDVVEWHEVKDPSSDAVDNLGCWSVMEGVGSDTPRHSPLTRALKLDVSYTACPSSIHVGHDSHAHFWSLAALSYPEACSRSLGTPRPSPEHRAILNPDEQLLCYDFLYFVSAGPEVYEYEHDYSPAWREIVSKLYFTPLLERTAEMYLRSTLSLQADEVIPPYIAVHVRHGDFLRYCKKPIDQCVTPLSEWAKAVREVQEQLRRKGKDVNRVIMTSDEENVAWWNEVHAMGWLSVKRDVTPVEHYGALHETFVDAVIQAGGIGVVGTAASTMSLLAGRRSVDWLGGIYRAASATLPDS